jgi:uncharacterized membrane protein YhaH (DUF805 family)
MKNLKHIYLSFNGRLSLKSYWLYCNIPIFIIAALLIVIFNSSTGFTHEALVIGKGVALFFAISTSAKRLHDINLSAWWLFIIFVPYIGRLVLFLACSFIPRKKLNNKYS